jgi:hypothetical protein
MQAPEETILKELLQKLKSQQLNQVDERRAQAFARTWTAAQAQLEARRQPRLSWLSWRFAVLVSSCLLVVGVVGWSMFGKRPASPPTQARVTLSAPVASPELTRAIEQPARTMNSRVRPLLRRAPATSVASVAAVTPFIQLRGEEDLAPLESGRVVRVEVQAATLIALGLPINVADASRSVEAELLIGQDGLARAIRFENETPKHRSK